MLKTRVIPTLLWKNLGLVKGVSFDSWRRVGTVMPAIKVYNTRDVDELILLDISATREGREPDYESLAEFASECFVPLTVGGGVRTVEHIRELLKVGADKVCINTAAYTEPGLVSKAVDRFGSQCIVASIDARLLSDGSHRCFSHSGTKGTSQEVSVWAQKVAGDGAGEILVTSIDRDGTMMGYDLELVRKVAHAVNIPVIASGGAGNYHHLYEALQAGASAIAAASIFHFTELTPLGCRHYLADKGVPVRNINAGSDIALEADR